MTQTGTVAALMISSERTAMTFSLPRLLPATAVAALVLATAACATTPPPPMVANPGSGQCDAQAVAWAVGQAATPELVEKAREQSGSVDVRVIEPGMAVTMDYRHDRLNLKVNERGAINGVSCG